MGLAFATFEKRRYTRNLMIGAGRLLEHGSEATIARLQLSRRPRFVEHSPLYVKSRKSHIRRDSTHLLPAARYCAPRR